MKAVISKSWIISFFTLICVLIGVIVWFISKNYDSTTSNDLSVLNQVANGENQCNINKRYNPEGTEFIEALEIADSNINQSSSIASFEGMLTTYLLLTTPSIQSSQPPPLNSYMTSLMESLKKSTNKTTIINYVQKKIATASTFPLCYLSISQAKELIAKLQSLN